MSAGGKLDAIKKYEAVTADRGRSGSEGLAS